MASAVVKDHIPREIEGLSMELATFNTAVEKACFTNHKGKLFELEAGLEEARQLLTQCSKDKGCIYILGNGGSSAVASHIVNDLSNTAKLHASTLHEPTLLTCFTNDYGYDKAYALILERAATSKDCLIVISSSGASQNMLEAAKQMKRIGGAVFSLSGFSSENALRQLGDINCWLDSSDYGVVEIGHLFLLHHLATTLGKE